MFHALLMGHEDWVNSIHWQSPAISNSKYHQPLALISSSADKSMILWKPDTETESWLHEIRFGEVGGTVLGYYGGLFSPDGTQVVGYGYHGAFQLWTNVQGKWVQSFGISGHQSKVQDLAWDPTGRFLLTTSLDQTTRLISRWNRNAVTSWHEIGRPQIHGYDLNVVAFLSKYEFVSGADEKVLRVFEAPRSFVETLQSLTGVKESEEELVSLIKMVFTS
jgi:elongator complex protein 2